MNIIIANEENKKKARLTQYDSSSSTPIDIQNIFIHVASDVGIVKYLELIHKEKIDGDFFKKYQYTIPLVQNDTAITPNYIDYTCSYSGKAIPPRLYNLIIRFSDDSTVSIVDNNNAEIGILITTDATVNAMQDEHEVVYITKDRKISSQNENILVAQDWNSQMIRFSINKKYDGISFLDDTKEIWVDYIPVNFDKEIEAKGANFLSDEITIREQDPDNADRILLHWLVPWRITSQAGTVTYALSVINKNENYVWQTLSSTLKILPNLGERPLTPITPGDPSDPEDATLTARVAALEDFVENIDYVSNIDSETGVITYVTNTDGETITTNYEVDDLYTASAENSTTVINGGGASN